MRYHRRLAPLMERAATWRASSATYCTVDRLGMHGWEKRQNDQTDDIMEPMGSNIVYYYPIQKALSEVILVDGRFGRPTHFASH